MPPDDNPTSLDGYNHLSIYRNYAIYSRLDGERYPFAAGNNERVWVFDYSFEALQSQLDEINAAGG